MSLFRSLAVLLVLAGPLAAEELRTLGGKTLQGSLTAVTDKEVTLTTDGGAVSVPLSQVIAVELQPVKEIPPGSRYTDVRLLDDTRLQCSKVAFQGEKVELTLLSGTTLTLPLNFVTSVLHEGQNEELKKQFDNIAAKQLRRDRIVILRDGELNPIDGTLGSIDPKEQTIQFRLESGKSIPVSLQKLHGMIFFRQEGVQEKPLCKVYDSLGNSLTAVKLGFDGTRYTLTTSFGAELALNKDAVARLDFNMGKLTFLSDMQPAKVVERSGIGLAIRYRKDMNLDGEPILLDGKPYTKGLSLHAHTELEYNLGGKYKKFEAVLGVDPRTGAESEAQVSIYCDGEKRFSETLTAQKTRPLALDVKGVGTLRIVVGSRNFLDLHDHATLADARVSQ